MSVMVSVPVREPLAVGVNVTPIVQFAPAATAEPTAQVVPLAATRKSPPAAIEVKFKASLPLFVTVTAAAALVAPTNWPPKATLDLDKVAVGPRPVPLSVTLCGLPGELSDMSNAPVRVPGAAGVNVTVGAQLPPGARVPQGFVATVKSPVVTSPVIVTEVVVLPLATVTGRAALISPTGCVPKLTVASPVRGMVCCEPVEELSLTNSEPKVVPANAAVNVTPIVQVEPGASVAGEMGQLVAWAKGLVARIPEMVNASVPLSVSVTIWGALVTPTACPGKSRLPGERLATAACPVPLSEIV